MVAEMGTAGNSTLNAPLLWLMVFPCFQQPVNTQTQPCIPTLCTLWHIAVPMVGLFFEKQEQWREHEAVKSG